jgi:hypothetical protein
MMNGQSPNGVTSRIHFNASREEWMFYDLVGRFQTSMPNCGWFEILYGKLDRAKEYVVKTPVPDVKEVFHGEKKGGNDEKE